MTDQDKIREGIAAEGITSESLTGTPAGMPEETEITPEAFSHLAPSEYFLIDTREESEHEHGAIPGSILMEPGDILEKAEAGSLPLPEGRLLILYCTYGIVTRDLALRLRELGVNARSLTGGYGAWALYEIRRDAAREEKRAEVERGLQKKFHGSLLNPFARAILRYALVKDGDRIAVCISGGKDSMLMAKLFQEFRVHGQFHFDLVFLCMDPGYNTANRRIIEDNAKLLGIPITFFETSIFETVYNMKTSPCYLCARMRRGYLYKKAKELGCNKIALGHHFDDVIETALMGMLSSGQFNAMMPKLRSTNYEGMELIRPLYFVREDDIKHWRDYHGLHFIQCACRFTDTCSTRLEELSRKDSSDAGKVTYYGSMRTYTKQLIRELKKTIPDVETNIFHATENVSIDQVLGYKKGGVRVSFMDEYSSDML